jgi:hypothetical protein
MNGLSALILFLSMALTSAMLLMGMASSDGWM